LFLFENIETEKQTETINTSISNHNILCGLRSRGIVSCL